MFPVNTGRFLRKQMNKNDQKNPKTKQNKKKTPNECQIKKQTSQKLIQLSINRQNTQSILFLPHVQQIGRRLQVCLVPAHVSKSGRFFPWDSSREADKTGSESLPLTDRQYYRQTHHEHICNSQQHQEIQYSQACWLAEETFPFHPR